MAGAGRLPDSLQADVFEAILAAVYLDGGQQAARRFIDRFVGAEIDLAVSEDVGTNYKSQLQQLSQREFGDTPVYQLLDEKGPDHSKCFKMAARIAGHQYHPAWGRNKKEAEQRAACNALSELNDEEAPYPGE